MRFLWQLILLHLILGLASGLQCNDKEYAVSGQRFTIDCHLVDFKEVYWYSETDAFTSPIVRLADNKIIISETSEGKYSLLENGALVIKNVTQLHYIRYKILTVHGDATTEEYYVQLISTVLPQQRCPAIQQCGESCHCTSDLQMVHNVTCSIHNARPKVKLTLVSEAENNPNVVFGESKIQYFYDNKTDVFDTVVSKQYHFLTCGNSITVRCAGTESSAINIMESSMTVLAEPCIASTTSSAVYMVTAAPPSSSAPSNEEPRPTLLVVFFIVIGIILSGMVFGITYFAVHRKRGGTRPHQPTPTNEDVELKQGLLNKKADSYNHDTIGDLIAHLEDTYRTMGYIKLLPWGNEFPVNKVYIDRQCKMTIGGTIYTKNLSSIHKRTTDMKRALLIAGIGNGKTTFQQYQASQWLEKSRKQKQKELLFILQLSDLDIHSCIADALCKSLPTTLRVNSKVMLSILKNQKCTVILDGLDEIEAEKDNNSEEQLQDEFTILQLLQDPRISRYPNLRLWVTSRDDNSKTNRISQPYTKIQIFPFTDEDIEKYIENTCTLYVDKKDPDAKGETLDKVRKVLKGNDHLAQFQSNPLLTVLFIHIVFSKLTSNEEIETLDNVDLEKIPSVVKVIIDCLNARYVNKQSKPPPTDFDDLHRALGKAVMEQGDPMVRSWSESIMMGKLGAYFNVALSIGLIKKIPGSNTSIRQNDSSSGKIGFLHDYIQWYCIARCLSDQSVGSQWFLDIMKESEENLRLTQICQFICEINSQYQSHVLKALAESGYWQSYINCLYGEPSENYNKLLQELSLKRLSEMKIHLRTRHECNALKTFLMKCKEVHIVCGSISFCNDSNMEFLCDLELSMFECVKIVEFSLNEESIMEILKWANKNATSICFENCTLPDVGISQILLESINQMSSKTLQQITKMDSCGTTFTLSRETGVWKKDT